MSAKTKGTPDDIDVHVGARLKTLRLARGASQSEMADKLGITFQQIQKYENAKNRISAGKLAKAAKLLGVPVQAFFPDEYTDNKQLDIFRQNILNGFIDAKDMLDKAIAQFGGKAS